MDTTNILQVQSLSVLYKAFRAVDDISFSINGGEIFGLLGPNGAGKTSTLSAIEGLLQPAAGQIAIAGFSVQQHPLQARAHMGVQLQSTSFQPELPVKEIIRLYAGLYGKHIGSDEVRQILGELKLEEAGNKKMSQLSGGQQQRVSLYIATIHNPSLIILDEPTTGLDPQSRRQLWERLEAMRDRGHAVLLTTHSMEEAEAVCDRVAIMDKGRILEVAAPQYLIDFYKTDAEILKIARRGKVTLEDVFIGLTGKAVRS